MVFNYRRDIVMMLSSGIKEIRRDEIFIETNQLNGQKLRRSGMMMDQRTVNVIGDMHGC